jgi:PAS domain S-box-containing protein
MVRYPVQGEQDRKFRERPGRLGDSDGFRSRQPRDSVSRDGAESGRSAPRFGSARVIGVTNMKLTTQNRITLVISALALAMVADLVLLWQYEAGKIDLLLSHRKGEQAALLDKLIDLKSAGLNTFVYDYTFWDEMVGFVATGNRKWAEQNLDVSLATYSLDAIWVFRPDLTTVGRVNPAGLDDPLDPGLAARMAGPKRPDGGFFHFFKMTGKGLIEIRGATIHPSADRARTTEPRGYLFAARLWSGAYLRDLDRLAGTQSRVEPAGAMPADTREDRRKFTVSIEKALNGWDGRPVAVLHSNSDMAIASNLYGRLNDQFLISLLFACLIVLILSLLLNRLVSGPMKSLSDSLIAGHDGPIRELAKRNSEFGGLARMIEGFYEQKNKLVEEIDQRRRAEESLMIKDAALESSISAIGLADMDGRIFFVNPAFVKLWGYQRAEEITGRLIGEFAVSQEQIADVTRALASGRSYSGEGKSLRTDGTEFIVQLSANPVVSREGQPVCMMASFLDVSEKKKADEELRLNEATFRALAVEKTRLLSEVNHRVGNNLTLINGILSLELQDLPEGGSADVLRDVQNRIQSMAMIHNLLSRTEWKPVSPGELAGLVVEGALSGSAIRDRIRVRVDAPEDPVPLNSKEATKLALIFNELTTNSVKYAFRGREQGTIDVRIRTGPEFGKPKSSGDGGRGIRIEFRDDGPGWPADVLRGKRAGIGLRLLDLMVRDDLDGELAFRNDSGAVVEMAFRPEPV